MACIACGQRFHDECENGGCETCHGEEDKVVKQYSRSLSNGPGGSYPKSDDQVMDRLSTGRKRAADKYPLNKFMPCEWRGMKNCGGGIPIIGCENGFQQDRHHGPVKDTLRNELGNVHRICKKCHKRWHFVNDPVYDEEKYDATNHEPEEATPQELREFELRWIRTTRSHVKVDRED
jgi:hypothetical protein